MKYLKYFYLVISVLILVIIIQNLEPSGLNVLFWKFQMPKGLLWGLLFILGITLSEGRHFFKSDSVSYIHQGKDLDK